ncbi:hypothetical protein K2Y00_02205 [Patescibacteria group bacterium]|nr:hypothetical protein [Patescibacteria group bacterium]
MEAKTVEAVYWIVGILNKHQVPYRIGGGFAARIYGSNRAINDIDISLPGKYFDAILPDVQEYITAGPKHYKNEKWDCDTLSLNYHGQEIDMTDIDTLRMSNKEKSEWFQTKDRYRKYPNQIVEIEGVSVSLIDPRDLVAYKRELDGDHQLVDIAAVEQYIRTHA